MDSNEHLDTEAFQDDESNTDAMSSIAMNADEVILFSSLLNYLLTYLHG